ncbi:MULTISPECIES: hypothetical protein [unclassified Bradyrhizobium]|uniref:hypothetical protein n=1 Tax=unclassified Bradyrhizobium TaxID=2631580 RepID=UPI00211EA0ED|nr:MULTISPECIES: hypothetical protein [unclassified Bradyrhizobium]MDD1533525.1 hypothetical protein [Bradyrhizobium sp. WBOS8]MDD1582130.1 hypothetical protein [Bradyrhizobium sp. WBOS4]UUO47294.1 hypothetical protein DCM78_10390 [Bradyrhizobium sp. WBOS04]UUO60911.1 hypothetical protein DCM80_18130 [Bradyrhizobium sp. WBOS08]
MLVLVGPILFIALILYAVRLQKRGLAGWKAALIVVLGSGLIVAIMFGLLFVAFEGFDRPPS